MAAPMSLDDRLSSQASFSLEGSSRGHRHTVQFYRNDSFLLEQLGQFVTPAIAAGSGVILVVTKTHRNALFAHLRKSGPAFALAVAKERFLLLDAEETLAKFMVKGQPDPFLFNRVMGDRMAQLASAAEGPNPQIFAFGEMVACLWEEGKREAALRLEVLWNQLAEKHPFHLLCAYPMQLFSQDQDRESLHRICAQHSHVIPPERTAHPTGQQDRLHSILLLLQKNRALEREIRERRRFQQALEDINLPLSSLAENIHLAAQQPDLCEETRQHLDTARRHLDQVAQVVRQNVDRSDN